VAYCALLLRGNELDAGNCGWRRARRAPEVTEAQRTFINTSENAENARLGKKRAQLEETARAQAARAQLQRCAGWRLGGVAALVLFLLGYVPGRAMTWRAR
jgi:hypothetical protein